MPSAPRTSGKSTKIAYRILGVPGNVRSEKKDNKNRKRLTFEDTYRVR